MGVMFCRPSGLEAILLELLTHGLRHGLRTFARFAGCEAQSVSQRLGRGAWEILLKFLTHGLRRGLRSFARFAGCESQSVSQRLEGEMPAYRYQPGFSA